MNLGESRALDALQQCFSSTSAERALQARRQFFEAGIRPSGLVSEAVIQSWLRSQRQHRSQRRLPLAPVSPSRLHATQERCRSLLQALKHELPILEQALAGTGTRVMLTDDKGIVLHVSPAAMRPHDERVGLNMSEQAMGTNAPGIVAATGQACTVTNGEHYFEELHAFRCAAAPIRDVHGRLAGVLNLMVEEQHFSFDASPVVGMYATTIENTLLQAQSHEHLVLRFQVTPALLHTPLQALMGVAADGRVAWMNGTAAQLIGQPEHAACSAQELLGHDLSHLLRLSSQHTPVPLRLANGLGIWMQAHLQTSHGLGTHLDASIAEDAASPIPAEPIAATETQPLATLREHSVQLIKETLEHHGGNVSQAARALGISRGTLYRRLRSDRENSY